MRILDLFDDLLTGLLAVGAVAALAVALAVALQGTVEALDQAVAIINTGGCC